MNFNDDKSSTKLVLLRIRLAYAMGLFRPKAFEAGQQPKFGCTCLFPPDHPAHELVELKLRLAAEDAFGDKYKKMRLKGLSYEPVLKSVADFEKLQTGNIDETWSFVRVSSQEAPVIFGPDLVEIAPHELSRACYPGRWANVFCNAYGYKRETGNGVTLGLNSVQLMDHDDRLGTRPDPKAGFTPEKIEPRAGSNRDDNDDDDGDDGDDDLKPTRPRRR